MFLVLRRAANQVLPAEVISTCRAIPVIGADHHLARQEGPVPRMEIAIDLQPVRMSRPQIGMADIIVVPVMHAAAVVDTALAEVMFIVHVQRGITPVPRMEVETGNVLALAVQRRIKVAEIEVMRSG